HTRALRSITDSATPRPTLALPFVVFDFLELGIDDVVVAGAARLSAGILLVVRVEPLRHTRRCIAEGFELRLDRRLVVALDGGLQIGNGRFDLRSLFTGDFVAELTQRLLGRMYERVRLVARL